MTARPEAPPRVMLYAATVCVVAGTVSWRKGVYFSGSLDPVVVLKAVLGFLALVIAASLAHAARRRTRLGVRTILLTTTYLVITCIGGLAGGTFVASSVVAVRVATILAILALLLTAYDVESVVTAVIRTMGATAALAIVTGVGSLAHGRLEGGIPPATPNELAFQCGALALLTMRRIVDDRRVWWDTPLVLGLLLVVWLTGSRTGLIALLVAMFVMLAQAKRISVPMFVGLVAAVPVAAYATFGTSLVTNLLNRGGEANVTTLASRTIAWQAVLQFSGTWWNDWFGGGLSVKQVAVSGQYWNQQLLDSSWMSALVQGGILGFVLLAVWVIVALVAVLRAPRVWRPFWTGLFVFVVGRSFLESGLLDASTPFMLFVLANLSSEPVVRAAQLLPEGVRRGSRDHTPVVLVGDRS